MVLPDKPFTRREGQDKNPIAEDVVDAFKFAFNPTPVAPVVSNGDYKKSGERHMRKELLRVLLKSVWGFVALVLLLMAASFAISFGLGFGSYLAQLLFVR